MAKKDSKGGKRDNQRTKMGKAKMLEALTESLGIVSPACKAAGISRQTFYQWLKADKNFKKQVDDLAEIRIDFAEHKLMKQIDKEDTAATIFFLKTKARHRGYVERHQVQNVPPPPIDQPDLTHLSTEEIKQILKGPDSKGSKE